MHFFTDPTLLNTQAIADPFGPMNGSETTKYNISSKHTVSASAKIFACQDTMMLVQPHVDNAGNVSANLVNLVLKPIEGLEIKHSPVKYYIYRGVDKASFITGTAINPASTVDKTEFIEKFWVNWNNYKTNTNQPALVDPTPQSFGFDSTLTDAANKILLLEEFYNSEASTNTLINDFQAIKVSEGEWLANFNPSVDFEFEIITDTDHLKLDLEYAQKWKQIIDVSGKTGLSLKAEKEKILNYIDPAAFFGMHYHTGIHLASYTGTTKNPPILKREKDLVDDIVNKFLNKTAVYLDVRSENGYSYNYYNNYIESITVSGLLVGELFIKLKNESDTNFNQLDVSSFHWPLVDLNKASAFSSLIHGEKINIQLRLNDNTKPILFAENPKLFGSANIDNFKRETDLVDPIAAPGEWTKTIWLEVPFVVNGATKTNVSHHIKLQYFRQEDNATSPNTIFKVANFLDAAYGGILIPSLGVATPFQHVAKSKKKFVITGTFCFVAENGVFQDDTRLLFYAENSYSLLSSGDVFPRFDITTVPAADVDGILQKKNVVYNKWQIREGATDIDVLGIVGYNRTSIETTPKENLLMLGLMKSELTALLGLPGLSDLHHKYFIFQEILGVGDVPQVDAITSTPYRKFRLDIQGLDSNGVVQVIDSSSLATNVEVYGTNLNMLCSKGFGAAATIPVTLPDPGIHTDFDHFHRFDYDANDPTVTSLFPGGFVTLDDLRSTPVNDTPDVSLIGEMFYPVDSVGSSILSPRRTSYPLIVLSHANGGRYSDYRDLGGHLAKNGFIVSVLSSLSHNGRSLFPLFPTSALLPHLTFLKGTPAVATSFPADYYLAVDSRNLDALYVYYNGGAVPLNSNYAFEKLTILRGTFNTTVAPNTFEIQSEDLLSWTKGTDFDIDLTLPIPFELELKFQVGFHGMGTLGRANLIYPHLQLVKNKFGNKLEQNFGLIGHSRGGEAVGRAAEEISGIPTFSIGSPATRVAPDWKNVPTTLNTIKAVISLSPTDAWDKQVNLVQNIPYFVLYGSMDGDVAGYRQGTAPNRNTGFSILDRAVNNTEKAMTFVHGASHNGFITNNHDFNQNEFSAFAGNLIDSSIQKNITKAYMNAFFRIHLKNEAIWEPLFQGDYVPPSIQHRNLFQQYKNMIPGEFDKILDFETGANIGTGWGQAALNGATAGLREGNLVDEDIQTPHDSKGLLVVWSGADVLSFNISATGKDVSSFDYLSFRIAHVAKITPKAPLLSFAQTGPAFNSIGRRNLPPEVELVKHDDCVNGVYSPLNDLAIKIEDTVAGNFQKSLNRDIPEPHFREVRFNFNISGAAMIDNKGTPDRTDDEALATYQNLTKSAMMTVRIPLSEYDTNGVDLTKIKEMSLIFPVGSGEIVIDDIEFTN